MFELEILNHWIVPQQGKNHSEIDGEPFNNAEMGHKIPVNGVFTDGNRSVPKTHFCTWGNNLSHSLDFTQKPTILVVDDTLDNLTLMTRLLKDLYKVKIANNGENALKFVQEDPQPDLILLDIMMPGLSGYDVCKILKDDPTTRDIPIIFLTAITATDDEKKGLELGAVDFITKPVNPPIVMARVATQLHAKAAADFLKDKAAYLETEVAKRSFLMK
jgi:putative two-component system response regulator